MATKKCLCLIYELENFANTYLGKVTKFQGDGLFCFGVLSNLLAWRWKTHPPGMNRVKTKTLPLWDSSERGVIRERAFIRLSTVISAEAMLRGLN